MYACAGDCRKSCSPEYFMPESVCMNDNCFLDISSDALHKQREGERGWVVRKYTETMQGLLVRVVSHFAGICC